MANFLKKATGFLSPIGAASMFGKTQNPADKAMPFLQQQPGVYKEQLNPFINRGNVAAQESSDIYSQMANNPAAYFDKIMASYNPRRGFDEFKNNELMRTLKSAAAAGGYAGGPYDQEMQGRLFNDLLEADRENWIERVLGIGKTGLEGQSHLGDVGFQGASTLADLLGSNLGQMAGLEYKGQEQKNANKNALLRSLIQAMGTMGGAAFGPGGAAAGGAMAGGFTGGYGGGQSLDSGSWKPFDFNMGRRYQ